MKTYKKILALAIILTLALTIVYGFAKPVSTKPLIAGKQFSDPAGEVIVTNDGSDIFVEYKTSGDWYITETHLYVGKTDPEDLSTAPGQFPYKVPDESTATSHKYSIPLGEIDGYHLKGKGKWVADGNSGVGKDDIVYIAAHAVVCKEVIVGCITLEDLALSLPDQVTVEAKHASSYDPDYTEAYMTLLLSGSTGGTTSLDGNYDGWCVDLDTLMYENHPYLANVYSSYEPIPAGLLYYPENLDLVNYILNQNFVGESSPGGHGTYTYGDVQYAIWTLIEDSPQDSSYLGPWDQERVDEILADIETHNGYEPGCDDTVVIILDPVDHEEGQPSIIEIPIPPEYETQCETAWGQGIDFDQRNWAMYFEYTIT